MSVSRPRSIRKSVGHKPLEEVLAAPSKKDPLELTRVEQAVNHARQRISDVLPLKDYIAVNPLAGLSHETLLVARQQLRRVCDADILMPLSYYRQRYQSGAITKSNIDAAIDELVVDGIDGAENIDSNHILATLKSPLPYDNETACQSTGMPQAPANTDRYLRTFAEILDEYTGTQWSSTIRDEVSKHCAAHYDDGQALWQSPWRMASLYQAWLETVRIDRNFELLGAHGLREISARLPDDPNDALYALLNHLRVPPALWPELLLCEALTMPGWSAWARQQSPADSDGTRQRDDFAGILAMRLTYEVVLSAHLDFHVDWHSVGTCHWSQASADISPTEDELTRLALLRATEIAYRDQLLSRLKPIDSADRELQEEPRPRAQMAFCIDVRSEVIRRHIEAVSSEIETLGFAGFFGLPIELVRMGEDQGAAQLPILLQPQFQIHEEILAEDDHATRRAIQRRGFVRAFRDAWKKFQTSAASTFSFVESTGLLFAPQLLAKTIGMPSQDTARYDGVAKAHRPLLGPSLRGVAQHGITTSRQVDLAESMLRGMGLIDNFGRLVLFCGHASQCVNNPLKAALDCGACRGHSGEPNARLAAQLCNQKYVRQGLADRGIAIPDDTHFLAALHNTTTDELTMFDLHDLPESHAEDLQSLCADLQIAALLARRERRMTTTGGTDAEYKRRSADWSEVRPEWGLAGNACFIAAPRPYTAGTSLDGRAFLHNYDASKDPQYQVLEQIMTAPLVVAHWINMQYYASTVEPKYFGSGAKTIHTVVGTFGVLSGNGGDLMTGLPWQSVHNGSDYQHHPLRLLAVIAAPRLAIDAIVGKHQELKQLLANGWMSLVAIEDCCAYRYAANGAWEAMTVGNDPHVLASGEMRSL